MKNRFIQNASIIFLIFLFYTFDTTASETVQQGKISGYVFNERTGQSIPDANIIISGTHYGTASQDGGYFFIDHIPQGTYDIEARVIGYQSEIKHNFKIDDNTVVHFFLIQQPIEMDPIIVSATLSEHLRSKVSISSEILTQARMKTLNGNTTGEMIESVGGLYSKTYDGFAGIQVPSIRGSSASQILVILDGVRLNTAQGGSVDLNTIPSAVLDRIEIVRGGHSALMGSDAVGGAIYLLSKGSIGTRSLSYGVHSTIGFFGTQNHEIFGYHKIGVHSIYINYNRTQSDGDFTYKTPDTGEEKTRYNNDYKADNIFTKAILNVNPNNKIQITYNGMQNKKGIAGNVNPGYFGTSQLTLHARSEINRQLISLQSENQITKQVRIKGQLFYQSHEHHYRNPDEWIPVDDRHKNQTVGLNVQNQITFKPSFQWISGFEWRQDKLKSTQYNPNVRDVLGVFIQTEIRYKLLLTGLQIHWTWIPAVRWDYYSDVQTNISPKLGLLITGGHNINLSIKGNLGQSFRVPTFDDLYWPEDSYSKGNPNLNPEISRNFDIGIQFSRQNSSFIQAEIFYFQNYVKNLINWAPTADNPYFWTPQNIGKAKIIGIESGLQWNSPANVIQFKVAHTWMQAIDNTEDSPDNGQQLIYRPNHKIDIIAGMNIGPIMVNLDYRIVSKRYINNENSRQLPPYELLNGNINTSITMDPIMIDFKIQGCNLLNKSIYLNDGYPLPGREVRLTFGIQY